MRVLRSAFAVLALLAFPLLAQERYIDRDLNFSVVAPPEWTWSHVDRDALEPGCEAIAVVSAPGGDRFSIAVSPIGVYRLQEQTMFDLIMMVQRDGARKGYKATEFHHVRSTAPIFPSYTYSYTKVNPDGTLTYVDGYLAAANRLYTIQYASRSRRKLDDFRRFIESFQLADKFEAIRGGGPLNSPLSGLPGAMKSAFGQPLGPNSGGRIAQ